MYKYFILGISFLCSATHSMERETSQLNEFATLYLNPKKKTDPIFLVPTRYKEYIAWTLQDNSTLLMALNNYLSKHHKSKRQLATQAFIIRVEKASASN